MDLSIVIVSYNHPDKLKKTLSSLFGSNCKLNFEVFVVDNASGQGNADMVKEYFPQVKLIENTKNMGFAYANNQALAKCRGEFALMLNPDIEVLNGSLSSLVEFMRANPKAAAAGGRLIHPDGSLQMSCRNFYTLPTIALRRTPLKRLMPENRLLKRHLMSDWHHSQARIVDWVVGACLIIRRQLLEKLGFLDDGFFMYFEDVDLCYRLRQAGFKTYYVPEATFIHFHHRESASGLFNRKLLWHIRSMLRFWRKHHLVKFQNTLNA